jgi:hypothetical protein
VTMELLSWALMPAFPARVICPSKVAF